MRNSHLFAFAVALTAASSVLFASSLSLLPAVSTLAGASGATILATRGRFGEMMTRSVEWRWLLVCAAFALAAVVVGGEGHIFFSKDDWLGRDAVLADLSAQWIPVIYAHDGALQFLRAPLGMYLVPAAFGHLFGLGAAHAALVAQMTALMSVFLYVVTLVWPRGRVAIIVLFLLFSGLDTIPVLLKTGGAYLLRNPAFWVDIGYYPANLAQFFWGPTHVLPGWLFAAYALLYMRREIDLAAFVAASLLLFLWSPLAMIGAVLLLLFFFASAPRSLLSLRFALVCGAGLALLPVVFYLRADAEAVPHRVQLFDAGFAPQYILFLLFGLTQAFFVIVLWRRVEPWLRGALAASLALLLAAPGFDLGYMNDIAQRASIAPRAVLAFAFDALLVDLYFTAALGALLPGAAIFLIGAVTPAIELYDTLGTPRFSISDCNLLTAYAKHNHERYLPSYIARLDAAPSWLFSSRARSASPLQKEKRICWPDRVYGENLFNWLKPENRIWLRRPTPDEGS